MKKYGKPYGDIASIKQSFVSDNEKLLMEDEKIEAAYSDGRKRKNCKICNEEIPWGGGQVFCYRGIHFNVCNICGHVNGEYDESEAFFHGVYDENDDSHAMLYYDVSSKEKYDDRVKRIYLPKVKFLEESISRQGETYDKYNYLDLGTGAGYFVKALKDEALNAKGIDVDKTEVNFGNTMIGTDALTCMKGTEVADYLRSCKFEVVSMIGVLEHVLDPNEILYSLSTNDNVKYIYFSVPTISFAMILGVINPNMFNRVLGGWHTHIFSDDSIEYLLRKYGFENIDEWRFGCDAADLNRFTQIALSRQGNTCLAEIFHERFSPLIDDIQLLFDKSGFSSETHVVAKKS